MRDINSKMQEFVNERTRLKSKADGDFEKAKEAFNRNEIDAGEYQRAIKTYCNNINAAVNDIRQRRETEIANINQGFHHKLTKTSAPDKFRDHYEKLQGAGRDAIEKHYNNSLKLNDEIGLKAAACVALEGAHTKIVEDYMKRDPAWAETLQERAQFHHSYMTPEAKMRAGMELSQIQPPRYKTKRVEDGFLADGQKVYRDKLI